MWKSHPKALPYLFLSEMWERFGYYLMIGIFTLYLKDVEAGFAMTEKEASDLYGTFIALVFLTPFLGGLIADRYLGYSRAVVIGGVMMGLGYCLMGIHHITALYVGMTLVIAGNGFFKPNISSMVGSLYPKQEKNKSLDVRADVPMDMLMMTWHMGGRFDASYHATDLITEVLGGGASARLYEELIKKKQIFSSIDCYHFGTIDPGLLVIEGKLVKGISMSVAEKAVLDEVAKLTNDLLEEKEVQKVINKTESIICFEDMSIMNRAHSLAFYELLGDAQLMNTELEKYQAVTPAIIQATAQAIFTEQNRNTLYYYSKS